MKILTIKRFQIYVKNSYLCKSITTRVFMKSKNFLIASSGIYPYMSHNDTANLAYKIARSANSKGSQIRMFMPRFGTVNERKHQLHEVIRLSGVNIVINDDDMPLIIKVASIPKERMQVYFIDNDEFFKRKAVFTDDDNQLFEDNDGRAVFFAKGVIETVKKLKWRPDYVLVFDWFASLLPLYIKTYYKNEPLFDDSKVYIVLNNKTFNKPMSENLIDKLEFDELPPELIDKYRDTSEINLLKNAIDLADGIIIRSKNLPDEIANHIKNKDLDILDVSNFDLDENEADLKAYLTEVFGEKETTT